METIKKNKNFDTVKMMREIRDRLSIETQDMTFAELKEYIKLKLKQSDLKPLGE